MILSASSITPGMAEVRTDVYKRQNPVFGSNQERLYSGAESSDSSSSSSTWPTGVPQPEDSPLHRCVAVVRPSRMEMTAFLVAFEIGLSALAADKQRVIAVSYTHLDVYKRQECGALPVQHLGLA